jgi:hypothetical protein
LGDVFLCSLGDECLVKCDLPDIHDNDEKKNDDEMTLKMQEFLKLLHVVAVAVA